LYQDIIIQGGQASSTSIIKCCCCPIAWRIGFQLHHSHARTVAAGKVVDGGRWLAIVATAMVTATAKGWGQAVDSAIMAKQRLGGLRPAITGDKKLYSKDEYDSNTESKVHK
jgi:hypothetical protein